MNSRGFFDELVDELLKIDSRKDMADFLRGILTSSEAVEIPKRLQIVKLLKAGVAQKEIAEKLGVGIATVTRGSKEVKSGKFGYVKEARIKNQESRV